MYDRDPYASELKADELGSRDPEGKGSFCKAASMLDVVGVCAIKCCGRTSMELKFSWPAIGDRVKNCCCITGSTDAATEFVDKATLLRTLTAIQSLNRLQ